MPNETLRLYATDKEIFDLLASARQRVSVPVLLEMARTRGIFYSPRDSRENLVSNVSRLPHDYDSIKQMMGKSENPGRAEKVTSITLNQKISQDVIKAVVKEYIEHAPRDEKATAHADSPDNYRLQVKYPELDYGRTRLLQKRDREADIRFEAQGDKTTIRLPANPKAREIAALLKAGIDKAQQAQIPSEVIDISDLSPEKRTLFFTDLISKMEGYDLRDVMNVKVQAGGKLAVPPIEQDDDNGDSQSDPDESVSSAMLAVVEDVALHGKDLLLSSEYQLLKNKGYFITSITWQAQQTDSPFNKVDFDAGFEEGEAGQGFRYNVRGFYRNKDGQFTQYPQSLSPAQRELIFPIIERTALSVLNSLREVPNPEPEENKK
jgi:hypothetical protein